MKNLLLLSIAIVSFSLISCKKDPKPTTTTSNTIIDTISVKLSITDTINLNPLAPNDGFGQLFVTPLMSATIKGLYAIAYIDFDLYDSTSFRYSVHSQNVALNIGNDINSGTQEVALKYVNGDSVINSNGTTKFNIRNFKIDSVKYDQSTVPTHFLKFAY